jgi:hypothetical protein
MWRHQINIANGQLALQSNMAVIAGEPKPLVASSGAKAKKSTRAKKKVSKLAIEAIEEKINVNFTKFIWQKINRKIVWLVLIIILAVFSAYLLRSQIMILKNRIITTSDNKAIVTNVNDLVTNEAVDDFVISGNIDNELIDLSFSDGGNSSSTATSTGVEEVVVIYLIVKDTPTGWLNLRENPSKSAKILTQVNSGDKFEAVEKQTVAGDSYDWYKVIVDDKISGWIYGQYITEIEG